MFAISSVFLSFLIALPSLVQGSVHHKEEFIQTYLGNISNSMEEKTELLEHILQNPNGYFLDIGTGGDAVAVLAKKLPKNAQTILIGADIDPLVIESIKQRQPEIAQYLYNEHGPKIELMTMSATNMKPLTDNSIIGIGASALTHEVFSYVPTKSALDQFLSEVCRVLEKNGVLVYRDPKWVDNPKERCIMSIHSEMCKYYTTLFLIKFLDRTHSLIKDYKGECCKPMMYLGNDVKVTVFLKNLHSTKKLSFEEFLKTPCSHIDYDKNFYIEGPKGLLAEIQRHYLMYLRDYYPIGLLEDLHTSTPIHFSSLCAEQLDSIQLYAKHNELHLTNEQITQDQLPLFQKELFVLRKLFNSSGHLLVKNKGAFVISNLFEDKIGKNLFFCASEDAIFIDPKILSLYFHGRDVGIFAYLEKTVLPMNLLEHLKLEGEEHYFYKTIGDLITYVGQYSQFVLKNTSKKGYCLAHIDKEHIKEAPRPLYSSILQKDMTVVNLEGKVEKPVTEKNIIHFRMQPERHAFKIFKDLIQKDPTTFSPLKQWIDMGTHEMLDLVSIDDCVIGALSRTEIYAKNLPNFRVINAFLINSQGDLWIPTRSATKTLFPNCLDCSVGGHVLSNESYFSAFCRETAEEINIDCQKTPYKLLAKLTPHEHGTSAFMEVYSIAYEGPVLFNRDDFVSGIWISVKELKKLLKQNTPAKKDLKIIIEACFPDA